MIPVSILDATVEQAMMLQNRAFDLRKEHIFLVRHPWTVTLGWQCPEDQHYEWPGLDVMRVDRGGGETIHFPGQIAAYVVIGFAQRAIEPRRWIDYLLDAAQATILDCGIDSVVDYEKSGIFTRCGLKLACTGLRKTAGWSRWGISLNVEGDLTPGRAVAICGDPGIVLTTMQEQGYKGDYHSVAKALAEQLQAVIDKHSMITQEAIAA